MPDPILPLHVSLRLSELRSALEGVKQRVDSRVDLGEIVEAIRTAARSAEALDSLLPGREVLASNRGVSRHLWWAEYEAGTRHKYPEVDARDLVGPDWDDL